MGEKEEEEEAMDLGQGFIDTEAKLNVDRGTCTLACFWACWWLPANGGQGGGGVHSCMSIEERCRRIHTHTQVHTNLNTPPPNTHAHTHIICLDCPLAFGPAVAHALSLGFSFGFLPCARAHG